MKMFFSVFFGAFFAIMAAAATLYWIKEYEDTESAKQVLQQTAAAPAHATITQAPASPVPEMTSNDQVVEPINASGDPTLIKPVTVKTADGEFTIPAGQVVQMVNEKCKPGTVLIKYDGYTFTIPSTAVASASR